MSSQLDIDVLRTLKAIKDRGGVSRAAEYLSLTQSAVSHKVRRFEDNIDCRLLRREPGMARFTEEGERLLRYAEKILSIHDEALLGINKPALEGCVRLGVTEELITAGFSDLLARFNRLYPKVNVKTRVEQSMVLARWLEKGHIDMAVMQLFENQVQKTDWVLRRDRLLWVKSPNYRLPGSGPIPFIAFDPNCFYRQWAEQQFDLSDQTLEVVLECASNQGICSAIKAGMGVALLAERHVDQDMERVSLVPPPDIVFVVRMSDTPSAEHLMALKEDIVRSL